VSNRRQLRPLAANRREVRPEQLGRAERFFGGYEGNNVPDDFALPAASIADVDRALFDFFNVSANLQVSNRGGTKQVPVVFAGAERYAMTKSDRPIRDRNTGGIITPIVAIHRTNVMQGSEPGMAFGTDTGDIVIRRRLSSDDRDHQKLINRFNLRNQSNVATSTSSRRDLGGHELSDALDNPIDDNIYEIITIPTPNFITLKYRVTFWTSFVVEMNQIIERVLNIFEVGTKYTARIETNKGYWYVAYFDEDWSMDDNFTDYTTQKRLIKSTMTISVPAWTLVADGPGDPSPLRRFVSAPSFDFDVCDTDAVVESMAVQMPMLGPEDPAFVRRDVVDVPIDGRITDVGGAEPIAREYIFNPFATSQAGGTPRFSRVVCRTSKGEKVGRVTDARLLTRITRP
jgi:hypothetical protein